MAYFNNRTNVRPGIWTGLYSLSGFSAPVVMSKNVRYYYFDATEQRRHYYYMPGAPKSTPAEAQLSSDNLQKTASYTMLSGEPPFNDDRQIYFEIYSGDEKGQDSDGFAVVDRDTYHATVSTLADDRDLDVTKSDVTVTLYDADGTVLTGAKVEIALIGVGVGGAPVSGAISPGVFTKKTNGAGKATFALWRNAGHPSGAYYQVKSWHPRTRKPIHTGQKFYVGVEQPIYELGELIQIVND